MNIFYCNISVHSIITLVMHAVEDVDWLQVHMLGIIAGIMNSYRLNPAQVQQYFENDTQQTSSSEESTESDSNISDCDPPLYVETRRGFCAALQNGKKICPSYSSCTDQCCQFFHIKSEFICPHVTRGIYCESEGCELIVIRACRKGKRCNDDRCSFRH